MIELRITAASRAAIAADAVACYPEEACGFIIERAGNEEVVRVTNVQNQRHAADPKRRDARTAYSMGPEAAPILIGHDRGELTIRAIYHSHPDHDAYFSVEDYKQATVWDEPSYPNAGQLVISVRSGAVRAIKAFAWNAASREFAEITLTVE
ncbi:MAG: Mov34/MPN/PAD-1 family protein [Deltaproteobacteria bacterium]|nr:Mov34/MPN/PAD-1 family protein [Deltaproteobacteria bacterium]